MPDSSDSGPRRASLGNFGPNQSAYRRAAMFLSGNCVQLFRVVECVGVEGDIETTIFVPNDK